MQHTEESNCVSNFEIIETVSVTISNKWISEMNNRDFKFDELLEQLNMTTVTHCKSNDGQHILTGRYDDIKIIKVALEKESNRLHCRGTLESDSTDGEVEKPRPCSRDQSEKSGNAKRPITIKLPLPLERVKSLQDEAIRNTVNISDSTVLHSNQSQTKKNTEFRAQISHEKLDEWELYQDGEDETDAPSSTEQDVPSQNEAYREQNKQLQGTGEKREAAIYIVRKGVDIDVLESGIRDAIGPTTADVKWNKAARLGVITGTLKEVRRTEKLINELFGECVRQDLNVEQNHTGNTNASRTNETHHKHRVNLDRTWEIIEHSDVDQEEKDDDPVPYHANRKGSTRERQSAGRRKICKILKQRSLIENKTANRNVPKPGLRSNSMPMSPFLITQDTGTKLKFKSRIINLTVHVYKGDIVHQKTDVIVNPTDCYLMNSEELPRAILQTAGQGVQLECQSIMKKYRVLPNGSVTFTSSGNLKPKVKHIIHAIGPSREQAEKNETEAFSCLSEMYKRCLHTATAFLPPYQRSISFPAVGSRLIGTTEDVRAIFEAITSFNGYWSDFHPHRQTSLTDIHLVDSDSVAIEDSIVTLKSLIEY